MKKLHLSALAAILASSFAATASADSVITLDNAFAFETPKVARAGGGFVTITNSGTDSDRLLLVKGDFPKVEIHNTTMDGGTAMMRPVEWLDIPAGETVALEPGGMHIMFMGLDGDPFEIGETVPVTLVFEKAGEVAVELPVVARSSVAAAQAHGDGMAHGDGHGMGHKP